MTGDMAKFVCPDPMLGWRRALDASPDDDSRDCTGTGGRSRSHESRLLRVEPFTDGTPLGTPATPLWTVIPLCKRSKL